MNCCRWIQVGDRPISGKYTCNEKKAYFGARWSVNLAGKEINRLINQDRTLEARMAHDPGDFK